ncbi:hypothetical protein GCM10009846_01950 [Agrococcus versicolor]|uniref:Uncharacterized protein n=1 Tax=Agrococcus versicolor TaxID=501482 RepID=A0ABP5MB66_9MICO
MSELEAPPPPGSDTPVPGDVVAAPRRRRAAASAPDGLVPKTALEQRAERRERERRARALPPPLANPMAGAVPPYAAQLAWEAQQRAGMPGVGMPGVGAQAFAGSRPPAGQQPPRSAPPHAPGPYPGQAAPVQHGAPAQTGAAQPHPAFPQHVPNGTQPYPASPQQRVSNGTQPYPASLQQQVSNWPQPYPAYPQQAHLASVGWPTAPGYPYAPPGVGQPGGYGYASAPHQPGGYGYAPAPYQPGGYGYPPAPYPPVIAAPPKPRLTRRQTRAAVLGSLVGQTLLALATHLLVASAFVLLLWGTLSEGGTDGLDALEADSLTDVVAFWADPARIPLTVVIVLLVTGAIGAAGCIASYLWQRSAGLVGIKRSIALAYATTTGIGGFVGLALWPIVLIFGLFGILLSSASLTVGSLWGWLFLSLAISIVLTGAVGMLFGWVYLLAFRPRPTWAQLEAAQRQAEIDAERRAAEADAAELSRVE